MAKSKSFFGLRKGSTKTMTYSVLKGQQITKDRVTDVANPKTQAQMSQRMLFANAVKFYKQAKSAFFRFAFEDKKAMESDFNAFMRHNAKNACAVNYPNYKEPTYPAFGHFELTQGSLPTPLFRYDEAGQTLVLMSFKYTFNHDNRLSELSTALLEQYPGLQIGDIVTIALVHTSLTEDGSLADNNPVNWDIRQFVIDPQSTNKDTWSTLGIICMADTGTVQITKIKGQGFDITKAMGCAIIFSRNTPSGLRVSTSRIIGNRVAQQFIESNLTPEAIKAAATTWGSTNEAILQGAIAK